MPNLIKLKKGLRKIISDKQKSLKKCPFCDSKVEITITTKTRCTNFIFGMECLSYFLNIECKECSVILSEGLYSYEDYEEYYNSYGKYNIDMEKKILDRLIKKWNER
jgi:hypothetical protein